MISEGVPKTGYLGMIAQAWRIKKEPKTWYNCWGCRGGVSYAYWSFIVGWKMEDMEDQLIMSSQGDFGCAPVCLGGKGGKAKSGAMEALHWLSIELTGTWKRGQLKLLEL